jgi:hypothetical protein
VVQVRRRVPSDQPGLAAPYKGQFVSIAVPESGAHITAARRQDGGVATAKLAIAVTAPKTKVEIYMFLGVSSRILKSESRMVLSELKEDRNVVKGVLVKRVLEERTKKSD